MPTNLTPPRSSDQAGARARAQRRDWRGRRGARPAGAAHRPRTAGAIAAVRRMGGSAPGPAATSGAEMDAGFATASNAPQAAHGSVPQSAWPRSSSDRGRRSSAPAWPEAAQAAHEPSHILLQTGVSERHGWRRNAHARGTRLTSDTVPSRHVAPAGPETAAACQSARCFVHVFR